MPEAAQLKIAAELAIHTRQQVQIESCCDTDRIIVSRELKCGVLLQIGSEQQGITRLKRGPHLAQEIIRCRPVEIADRASQKQNTNVLSGLAARRNRPQ